MSNSPRAVFLDHASLDLGDLDLAPLRQVFGELVLHDASTGEQVWVPAVPVQALDATGAGDVFAAGTVFGLLAGWPLRERLAFAALCSALAVQQFGGSLAAPGWGDIQDWYHERETAAQGGDASAAELLERYAFLPAALESHCPCRRVRRAEGTFAIFSDAEAGQE